MIKILLAILLIIPNLSVAQTRTDTPSPLFSEENGTNTGRWRWIKFSDGTTTDNGDGSLTVDTGGGGGSGAVGIGTTNWIAYYPANGASVVANNNIQLVADNVGINSANPTYSLDIYGNSRIVSADSSFTRGALFIGDARIHSYANSSAANGGNIFIGQLAGNGTMTSAAEYNITIGEEASQGITSGARNIALGGYALNTSQDGSDNVAIGYQAMQSATTTSNNNIAIGYQAMQNATNSTNNVVIGYDAGPSINTDDYNVYIGGIAGTNATAGSGTFVGYNSGKNVSSGGSNICIGRDSCDATSPATALTGTFNTFIGYDSGFVENSVTGSTAIGTSARVLDGGAMALGGTETYRVNVGIGTWAPIATLDVTKNSTMPLFALRSSVGSAADVFIVNSDGNVGIASTNPTSKLAVNGDIKTNITGSTQCVQADTNGVLSGTGSACGGSGSTPGGGQNAVQYDNANAFAGDESQFSFNGTNVGVGTSNGREKLEVVGNAKANIFIAASPSASPILYADGDSNTGIVLSGPDIVEIDTGGQHVMTFNSTQNVGVGTLSPATAPQAQLHVVNSRAIDSFRVNDVDGTDTSPFLVSSVGNVGIGTIAPDTLLNIVSGTTNIFKAKNTAASGSGAGAGFFAQSDDGAALVDGDRLGFFLFGGSTGSGGATQNGAGITGYAEENWTGSSIASNLRFETAPTGSTNRTERMRITSTGNIGVGTTIPGSFIHLKRGSGGGSLPDGTTDTLTLEASTSSVINTIGGTSSSNAIYFSDDSRAVGRITYSHASNFLSFHTNSTERMRIDTNGNIGIGTTLSLNARLHVASTAAQNVFRIDDDGTGDTTPFIIDSVGNVGIGTTNTNYGIITIDAGAGYGQIRADGATGGCLMIRDTDDAGWTECNTLDGVFNCTVDNDGVCDGT